MHIKFQGKKGYWGEEGWKNIGFLRFMWLWLSGYVVRVKMGGGKLNENAGFVKVSSGRDKS